MGRPFGWRSLVLVAVAACTGENVTAPGVCPQFCTAVDVQVVDTVLSGSIRGDSSYAGYVLAHSASQIMVAGPGSVSESRAVLRFFRFADTIPLNTGADTSTRAVAQTDSFRLMLVVNRQAAAMVDPMFALYRLPPTTDSSATFADLDAYFANPSFIREYPVPPDAGSDSVYLKLDPADLPTFRADSLNVAIGVGLRSSSSGFVELGASEALRGAVLYRYVKVDSVPGNRVNRTSARAALLDTHVFEPLPPPGANAIAVGGAPSRRSILRVDVPRRIVDSSDVVRATLFLFPAEPVFAAPGDTLRIFAHAMAADIGAKSPVLPAPFDSLGISGGRLVSGMNDTISVDVTAVVRSWRRDSLSTPSLVLRIEREAGSFGEVRFWSTADATRRPLLDITYVPPLRYEGR